MVLKDYDVYDSALFIRFHTERGLAEGTIKKYRDALKRYVEFTDETLEHLIAEADNEEETVARSSKRKIKQRLIDFRVYLKQKYASNTLTDTMTSVSTFYRHFDITVPKLPKMSLDESPNDEIEFRDLPTIEDIRTAIENVHTPKQKALFIFMACNGTSRMDIANFKYKQFKEAIQEFCPNVETPKDIIEALDGRCDELNIIPVFKMKRAKTKYRYHTIITPEATQFCINYLKHGGQNLKDDDLFFDLNPYGVASAFKRVNNKMNWGKRGTFDFFSTHRVRKFNASVIQDDDFANYIQGRKPTRIKRAYYKMSPDELRKIYQDKYMYKFSIYAQYDVLINNEAYQKLLSEKNQLKSDLQSAQDKYESLKNSVADMRREVDNVTRINDIAKIQDYIVDNEIVNKYNLASKIIELYKQDIKKDDFEGVTNSYIDDLIMIARNMVVAEESTTFDSPIYNDDDWKRINDNIDLVAQQHMFNLSLELSDGLRNKLNTKLNEYAKYLWKNEQDVDEFKVQDIIDSIALRK